MTNGVRLGKQRLAAALRHAYSLMRARFGHQHWWPGETPFEICVGAILTQNTNWGNVERAIANLKAARVLEPKKLVALTEKRLAILIHPAGYFNVKARRLRSFLRVLVEKFDGDLKRLFAGDTPHVRERLLTIHGIGPETADSMLLYAGHHLSFVIDAYTKRILHRHGWCGADATYDHLQKLCAAALETIGRDGNSVGPRTVPVRSRWGLGLTPASSSSPLQSGALRTGTVRGPTPFAELLDCWQDYHAQLVMVGKDFCRPREPRCEQCPLRRLLPFGE